MATKFDVVQKAAHYNVHPSGVEAILIVRHLSFDLGNCFKYVFRFKGKESVRSLKSALYYFNDHVREDLPDISDKQWSTLQPLLKRVREAEKDGLVLAFMVKFSDYLYTPTEDNACNVADTIQALIKREEADCN